MSSTHYKQLISYMPSMAAVVNSFQSPEVQLEAFQRLIGALEEALNVKQNGEPAKLLRSTASSNGRNGHGSSESDVEITHDLVDGESIHSVIGE